VIEAVRNFEMLVNLHQSTQYYNPEDSHLRTHRHANIKFYREEKVQGMMTVLEDI
jgi:hypothetical protein